jgi:hypothetical protein
LLPDFYLGLNKDILRALSHAEAHVAVANFVLIVLPIGFFLTKHYLGQIVVQSAINLRALEVQHRSSLGRLQIFLGRSLQSRFAAARRIHAQVAFRNNGGVQQFRFVGRNRG